MKTFRDNAGREWLVEVNGTTAKRVRGLLGVNLFALVDDGFAGLGRLLADPIDFLDVLYVLCKPEADARGISDEDFGRAMGGDALGAASDAFLAEYTDFFPDRRKREALRKVLSKGREVGEILLARAEAELDALDVASLATRSNGSSTASPASSASTPDPSPSASS